MGCIHSNNGTTPLRSVHSSKPITHTHNNNTVQPGEFTDQVINSSSAHRATQQQPYNIRIDCATHHIPFLPGASVQPQLIYNSTPTQMYTNITTTSYQKHSEKSNTRSIELYDPSIRRTSVSHSNATASPCTLPSKTIQKHNTTTITTSNHTGSIARTTSINSSGMKVQRKMSFQHGSITGNNHHISYPTDIDTATPRTSISILSGDPVPSIDDDSSLIVTIPFFSDLTMKNIRKLQRVFQRKLYKSGDYIQHTLQIQQRISHCHANSTDMSTYTHHDHEQFYVLVSGTVQISVPGGTTSTQSDIELVQLNSGSWFSSSAIIDDSMVNTVNIRAVTDCTVLSISASQYQSFASSESNVAMTLFDKLSQRSISLRKLPFLDHITEVQLAQLSQLLQFKRYSNNDVVFRQGDAGDGMYIIASGILGIYVNMSDGTEKQVDVVSQNGYFGEISLLYSIPRTATIRACGNQCILIYLSRQSFELYSKLAPDIYHQTYDAIQQSRTTSLLRVLPLFDVLTKQVSDNPLDELKENTNELRLRLLASLFVWEKYTSNTVVFNEGDEVDEGSKLYVIVHGSVDITVRSSSGHQQKLQSLHEREIFGELALINNTIRTASVTTDSNCTFLVLTSKRFHAFLEVAPELKPILQTIVGQRSVNIISQLPLFQYDVRENKPWSKLSILGELCRFEKYSTDETIVNSVDKLCNKFYCIVEGSISIKYTCNDADYTVLRKGGSFGENCVLQCSTSVIYSATALERTVVLTLTSEAFSKFLELAPELHSSLIIRNSNPMEPRTVQHRNTSSNDMDMERIDSFGASNRTNNHLARSTRYNNPTGSATILNLSKSPKSVSNNRNDLITKRNSTSVNDMNPIGHHNGNSDRLHLTINTIG